jgi:hypothetical protein
MGVISAFFQCCTGARSKVGDSGICDRCVSCVTVAAGLVGPDKYADLPMYFMHRLYVE